MGCGCTSQITRLNRNGPQWCREHLDEIVDDLAAEIDKRARDNPSWAVRLGTLPGRRRALRLMVIVAIRRAERDLKWQPSIAR